MRRWIAYILIVSFTTQTCGWSGNEGLKLAPTSLFKYIERSHYETDPQAALERQLKAAALDDFLKDPETREALFTQGRLPGFPEELKGFLDDFFKATGRPLIRGAVAEVPVRLNGEPTRLYVFKDEQGISIDPERGIRNAQDLALAREKKYWLQHSENRPAMPERLERILLGLSEAYPSKFTPIYRAISKVLGSSEMADISDIEVHGDTLRIRFADGKMKAVPFDAAALVPGNQRFGETVLHHQDTSAVVLLSAPEGVGFTRESASAIHKIFEMLQPFYKVVEGKEQNNMNALLVEKTGLQSYLQSLLSRNDLESLHSHVRDALEYLIAGRYCDCDHLLFLLETIGKKALPLDPYVSAKIRFFTDVATRRRNKSQPILLIRTTERRKILKALGLETPQQILDFIYRPGVYARVVQAHPQILVPLWGPVGLESGMGPIPGSINYIVLNQLVYSKGLDDFIDSMKENDFINIFLMDKSTSPGAHTIYGELARRGVQDSPLLSPDTREEVLNLVNHLEFENQHLFSQELNRFYGLDSRGLPLLEAGKENLIGFFPGLGSRDAYRNLGSGLYYSGHEEIRRIYQEGAKALGLIDATGEPDPTKLFITDENLPKDPMEKSGFIGAAFVIHNLALEAYLRLEAREAGVPLKFSAYTGESFGVLLSAVASGSLSIGDGVKIAQFFTPTLLDVANDVLDEAYHVIGINANNLEEMTPRLEARFQDKFEVHKRYSAGANPQVNVYVAGSVFDEFSAFMKEHFPEAGFKELKPPTKFIAHSRKLGRARFLLRKFIHDQGILFHEPKTPILSNNGTGVLTSGADVQQAVLAMVNQPMDSQGTVRLTEGMMADLVVEIGLGGKTRELVQHNHLRTPYAEYAGDQEFTRTILPALNLHHEVKTALAALRKSAKEDLSEEHYQLLRRIFRVSRANPFCEHLLFSFLRDVIQDGILMGERDASPAYYRFLEIYQHTRHFRDYIDITDGELVSAAVFKQRIVGGTTHEGKIDAELMVLHRNGTHVMRSLTKFKWPEFLIFNFNQGVIPFKALTKKARFLIETQPLARDIYESIREGLGLKGLDYFISDDQVPDSKQLAVAVMVYQYTMAQLFRPFRAAVLGQNAYLASGTDAAGLITALAVTGAIPLVEGIKFYQAVLDGRPLDMDSFFEKVRDPPVPVVDFRMGRYLHTKKDIEAALKDIQAGTVLPIAPFELDNKSNYVISFDPVEVPIPFAGQDESHVIYLAGPDDILQRGINPKLDELEDLSTLAMTDQNGKVFRFAEGRQTTTANVYAYVNAGEEVIGFGQGGSDSLVIFLKKPGETAITVRKVLSERLMSVIWDTSGQGVMMPPFTKAKRQAEFLMGLPESVQDLFPRVFDIQERDVQSLDEVTGETRVYHELIYDMNYVSGEDMSEFIREYKPSPEIVAHIYQEIFRYLRERIHTERRRVPARPTLEPSYLKKIEDRLKLAQKTAPHTFSDSLLKSDRITINGKEYLNIGPLLRKFREHPEFLGILEPQFHSLVVGDTNTENIKLGNIEPILKAMRTGEINFTAEDIGLKFLDPRAIGFYENGKDTGSDDPMYDNKPWHNSIGNYDVYHGEYFDIEVEQGPSGPQINTRPRLDNPYMSSYEGMETHFKKVMTAALGLDSATSQYLKEDPYWLIRFAFVMGTHFTAMPPFHFSTEVDGTLIDDYTHQRRPVAIYAEGIKWLNLALEMLEGKRTEYLGFEVPPLPYLAQKEAARVLTGPQDMSNESRVFFSPWSRLARGTGLGPHTTDFDPAVAAHLRSSFDALGEKVPVDHAYNNFSRLLTELILDVEESGGTLSHEVLAQRTDDILNELDKEKSAYQFSTAAGILIDAYAKLGLDPKLLVNGKYDLVKEALEKVETIPFKNDGIYGYYERVTAYTSLFVAISQLGMKDRLITPERNYIELALSQLETIPSPWNRGRGASMLFAALKILGFENVLFGERDYIKETLDYIDRAEELQIWPTFPAIPLTHAYFTIEPYITMLNAISILGRPEYLSYKEDRIAKVNAMMAKLTPEETTLIGEYYLLTLYNLGVLDREIPNLDEYLRKFVDLLKGIKPAPHWFPNGVSYPYAMEALWFFGRTDLITDDMIDAMVDSMPDFVDPKDLTNWGHPLSYILNTLGQLGRLDRIFSSSAQYGSQAPLLWGIRHFAADPQGLQKSIPLFDHALISLALRMRGKDNRETPLYQNVTFLRDRAAQEVKLKAVPILQGPEDMSREFRLLHSPWIRIARGTGLGQQPVDYDPSLAGEIRKAFSTVEDRTQSQPYTQFSKLLTELILDVESRAGPLPTQEIKQRVGEILETLMAERDPYEFAVAGSILIDAFGKLGLDPTLLVNEDHDFIEQVLAKVEEIPVDSNRGSGYYERVSAYASLFLAMGQIGLANRLKEKDQTHVGTALAMLDKIPSALNRGRAASTLVMAFTVLGLKNRLFEEGQDVIQDIFDFLDQNEESLPGMTPAFSKVFPLLTLLNAVSISGKPEYLTYKQDRLAQITKLMSELTPAETALMAQYYLITLYNLGELESVIPDLEQYLRNYARLADTLETQGPWFPNGVLFPYILETLWFFGRLDLISGEVRRKMISILPTNYSEPGWAVNRDNPLSYILSAFTEMGLGQMLFNTIEPSSGQPLVTSLIQKMADDPKMLQKGLPSLSHSLINGALRMRGANRKDTPLYENVHFLRELKARVELPPYETSIVPGTMGYGEAVWNSLVASTGDSRIADLVKRVLSGEPIQPPSFYVGSRSFNTSEQRIASIFESLLKGHFGKPWRGEGAPNINFFVLVDYAIFLTNLITGYFQIGIDPYTKANETRVLATGLFLQSRNEAIDIEHLPPLEALQTLTRNILYGNKHEGVWAFQEGFSIPGDQSLELAKAMMEIGPEGTLDMFIDNGGPEFAANLQLASYVLEHNIVGHLRIHIKPYPYSVSDVWGQEENPLEPYVLKTLSLLKENGSAHTALVADRVQKFLGNRLQFQRDEFLAYTQDFKADEERIRGAIPNSDMVIFVGDYLYTKLFGNRQWPHTEDHSKIQAMLPSLNVPLGIIRMVKAPLKLGLPKESPHNNTVGMIQVFGSRVPLALPSISGFSRGDVLQSIHANKLLVGMHVEEIQALDAAGIVTMGELYEEKGIIPEIGASPEGIEGIRRYRAQNPKAIIAAGEIGEYNVPQALAAVQAGANILVALENPISRQVVRAVRKLNPNVIIIAAASSEEEAEQSIEAGVDGIKIRPFALDPAKVSENVELVMKLRARHQALLVGGSRGIQPEQLGSLFEAGLQFIGLGVKTALAGADARDQFLKGIVQPVIHKATDARISNEQRVMINGWVRISQGAGLGMMPTQFDPKVANELRNVVDTLRHDVPASDTYNLFSNLLTEFILDIVNSGTPLPMDEIPHRLQSVIAALQKIEGALLYVNASALLFETIGKLGLDPTLLRNSNYDLIQESLTRVSKISYAENTTSGAARGKLRGKYDQLIGYTQLFLAIGHLGMKDILLQPVSPDGNYIETALTLIDDIPSAFARGRYAASFFSALKVLGFDHYIFENAQGRDHLKELLDYMDNDTHPEPIPGVSPYYVKAYPLFLTLMTVGVLGKQEYLSYKKDRFKEARDIMSNISDSAGDEVSKLTMLYLFALSNLGVLESEIPDLDQYLENWAARVFNMKSDIIPDDPLYVGRNMGYTIEALMLFGREDLITDEAINRWISYLNIEGMDKVSRNEPYNAGYILTVLGEMNRSGLIFTDHPLFGNQPPLMKFVKDFLPHIKAVEQFLPLLNHALINYALRMRGPHRADTGLYENVRFLRDLSLEKAKEIPAGHVEILNPDRVKALNLVGGVAFWDFDETLWTGFPREEEALLYAQWINGTDTPTTDQIKSANDFLESTKGFSSASRIQILMGRHQNLSDPDAFNERRGRSLEEKVKSLGRDHPEFLVSGASNLLASLKERGVEQEVVTGGDARTRQDYARNLGIAPYFRAIHGDGKKIEQIMARVTALGLSFDQVIFIDDGEKMIRAAHEAGIATIGFALSPGDRQRLIDAGADMIIHGNYENKDAILEGLNVLFPVGIPRPEAREFDPRTFRALDKAA